MCTTKTLSVSFLLIFIMVGALAAYHFTPYQAVGVLVFHVKVHPTIVWTSYENVTFSLSKFYPIHEEAVSVAKVESFAEENPKMPFLIQANITLECRETKFMGPSKTIEFQNEGEYVVTVPFRFDGLQAETYLVNVTYSYIVNQKGTYWHSQELYLTIFA